MKTTKLRLISTILILSMIFPILSGVIQPVFAADSPLDVQPFDYNQSAGTLKLRWESKPNIGSVVIKYHMPTSTGAREVIVPAEQIDLTNNVATITNVQSDIVYDFHVQLIDSVDSGITFTGKLFFLPKISVYAEQVNQQPSNVGGGGVESGVFPSLKISWKMPRVFDGSSDFVYLNDANALDLIDPSLNKLDFKFHINHSNLTDVEVRTYDNGNSYKAFLSGPGNESKTSQVKWDGVSGRYSFYLLGAKDDDAVMPTMDEIINNRYESTQKEVLPIGISQLNEAEYVLPHPGIRPGTIYIVTMDTLFEVSNQNPDPVYTGLPENPLAGTVNYCYTPVRFQLTKTAENLIYVRVYKVSAGDALPKLFYEIQTSNKDTNIDSNWTFRTQISDTQFASNAKSALTSISGINPLNTVYYRVVVTSENKNDRIQSLNLPYRMQDDTAKPPVPNNVSIVKVELDQTRLAELGEKTSNITIAWDKPTNWDELVDKDIYFHFMLNVNPKDPGTNPAPTPTLEADGREYGQYEAKYRLIKFVSSRRVTLSQDGTKLLYTIRGLDLFTGEDSTGTPIPISNELNNDGKPYPTYLLPNKTYYLEMYTTEEADRGSESNRSERSLTTSFTTLSPTGREVPTPKYLELEETKIITSPNPVNAQVKLRFDAIKIDWSNYTTNPQSTDAIIYDLYMATSTEPSYFHMIGSTEAPGDVRFDFQTINDTTWVYPTINKFTNSSVVKNQTLDNLTKFGNYLSPNATYYFMVKVRLRTSDANGNSLEKESYGTALLPVTTPRGEPTTPDDTAQRPLTPVDFKIAEDKDGNLMLSGESVTFEWTVQENEAAYNLIATEKKVGPDTLATDSNITEDPIYKSFVSVFGNKDNNIDGNPVKLTLDPKSPQLPGNFTYDPVTKKCRYTINTWLFPNKVYYFSIRSEIYDAKSNLRSSLWVSIPVTTALIEQPSMLQVVNNCEMAFYWYDTLAGMTTENYKLMLKASDESDYTQLTKSQYTLVKDGSIYYARILKLKPNTQYTAKAIRTTSQEATNNKELSVVTRFTRNDYYQIDLKWQGATIDPFSGFEIAIKTEDDSDYTVLKNNVDLEQYFDTSTQTTYPYYIEKSNSNLKTNYYTYNARINLAEVTLPDGTKEHKPLKPNTKYYIKVRAVKYDASNSAAFTASKYIGPVNTRTEFSQDDYDDEDDNTGVIGKFLDMLDKLEQGEYWDVSSKNGTTNKILVRDDKVINLLQGFGYYSCIIDISNSPDYVNSDEVYMAKDILMAIKSSNKSVILKSKNVEYTIRPDTFDTEQMEEFKSAKDVKNSKDVYLKITNIINSGTMSNLPANVTSASKVYTFSAEAITSKKTSTEINNLIKDKLYNDKTGIIQKKVSVIKNPNNTNVKGDAEKVAKYLDGLLEEVRSELSYYVEDTLNGVGYTQGVLADKFQITAFNSPLLVKMAHSSKAAVNPYVLYGGMGDWNKLTHNLKKENGYISYVVSGTGKYALFSSKDISDTLSDTNTAKAYIEKLTAQYDLTGVFSGIDKSFNPDLNVTVKEAVLLYELLSEDNINEQIEVKTKAKTYGLDKIINTANLHRNITRQETAAIIVKLYCQKTGTDYFKLKASYGRNIKDDGKISDRYAVPVYYCLEMKILNLDSNGNFSPEAAINRAGFLMAFEKMLEL